jgi:2'-5' RNA ligase
VGGLAGATIVAVSTRLFVGVWPPADVLDALRSMPRPDEPAVRWSTPGQWHVTLRFLGAVDDVAAVRAALAGVSWSSAQVDVGPATARLGPSILMLPVRGLDELAGSLPFPLDHDGFTGHLTVARARGRRGRVPSSLEGIPFSASWRATSFSLVRSQTLPSGAVYDDVASFLSSDAELMQ